MRANAMTMEGPRRPGRPRSELATAAVLDAAYRLSAGSGLRGTSIQAIAAASGVSKMTIYKWWPSRLHLLIDAYLRQATALLPLSETAPPLEAIRAHVVRYLAALQGDLGRVQLAVLAECLAEHGNSDLFVERYLRIRRDLGLSVIRRGQSDGSIVAHRPAEVLYDQIYGTIFYRCQFGLDGLDRAFVKALVDAVLRPAPGA
ncbi:MAG: TetR/AcrR family transcriptional regulator [Janthinobacterium lividum]